MNFYSKLKKGVMMNEWCVKKECNSVEGDWELV